MQASTTRSGSPKAGTSGSCGGITCTRWRHCFSAEEQQRACLQSARGDHGASPRADVFSTGAAVLPLLGLTRCAVRFSQPPDAGQTCRAPSARLDAMRWLWLTLIVVAVILVPFFLFEDYFTGLADRAVSGDVSVPWAVTIIAGLLAVDVLLPVPSSVVSAAAGVLLGFWLGATVV